MGFKNNNLPRCPKCNEQMKPVEDAPQFAQFLLTRTFKCERCQIALNNGDNDDQGDP